ncbi:MAG: acetylglutamate kinase [Ilumatobacteraceae bacterium]|nr:acetylglutamate kinase [Ilumatobacteraceae bacterium]MBJ7421302.1 acetylglutamate kinase [Ilumatobacteraceae bacterium]
MSKDTRSAIDPQVADSAKVANLLIEALPYIQKFAGKVVVIKYGGNALAGASESDALGSFAKDVALLHAVGIKPVVVHGGGPQISALMERLGKTPSFHNGLRVTDAETMEIVSMVLLGTVNPQLVSAINQHGAPAVGVSGQDANMFMVTSRDSALGFVGDITKVDATIVKQMLDDSQIPVVATLGTDNTGQAYNINADTAAGALAEALGAQKLVYLTDIAGVRADKDDQGSLLRQATTSQLRSLLGSGAIDGGMIPKIESCVAAIERGVFQAHILDGRIAHVLLLELFTDAGVGTMVSKG